MTKQDMKDKKIEKLKLKKRKIDGSMLFLSMSMETLPIELINKLNEIIDKLNKL